MKSRLHFVQTSHKIRKNNREQNTEKNKLDVLMFANEWKLDNVEFIEEQMKNFVNKLKNTQNIVTFYFLLLLFINTNKIFYLQVL